MSIRAVKRNLETKIKMRQVENNWQDGRLNLEASIIALKANGLHNN